MKQFLSALLIMIASASFSQTSFSGCTLNGGMGVYTACNNGQGCTLNCNLSATYSAFGPMCNGTEVNGNCFGNSAAQQNMSTQFTLPAGCTANVTAEFKKRGGACTNSGMDSGDKIGINSASTFGTNTGTCGGGSTTPGVTATGCLGTANGDVNVTFTQTGGTILIWGQANRSDEIITYTMTLTGTCGTNCSGVLPITLSDFTGETSENAVLLKWNIASESDVVFYQLEKSTDAVEFNSFQNVPSISETSGDHNLAYFAYDFLPSIGFNYYRLSYFDKEGKQHFSKTIGVLYNYRSSGGLNVNVHNDFVHILLEDTIHYEAICIMDISGRVVKKIQNNCAAHFTSFPKSDLPEGIYFAALQGNVEVPAVKLIIQ